jgi:hypothetical protein
MNGGSLTLGGASSGAVAVMKSGNTNWPLLTINAGSHAYLLANSKLGSHNVNSGNVSGVQFNGGGYLKIDGGSIESCKYNSSGTNVAGALWIDSGATVDMLSGSITDCTAPSGSNGGAALVKGTFNWSGGTITDCSGSSQAVYTDGGAFNNTSGHTAN